jgi:16S rRNA G966 N2-methylase RsmD
MGSTRDFLVAAPPFLGCKRRLCPLIFALLKDVFRPENWRGATFIDPFSGSGAVALYAKAVGFDVMASDVAERAVLVARALVGNSSTHLTRADIVELYCDTSESTEFVRELEAVLAPEQARVIARIFTAARASAEPRRSLLQLLGIKALLRCVPHSLPRAVDARRAARNDFDRVTSRRTRHYLSTRHLITPRGLWKVSEEVNVGVLPGRGEVQRADARHILTTTRGDVVYLDPPYGGTSDYRREYRSIDRLLGDAGPAARAPNLDELIDAARAIPILVLSYGGPGATLADVTAVVGRYRRVRRAISVPYPHLYPISKEAKRATNKELLVVATR